MTLKQRFMEAVSSGELGAIDDFGITVSLKQFKSYFQDVKSDYINSFLPAAVIETGQYSATHTKYLFRIRKGMYRVHPDAITEFNESNYSNEIPVTHIDNEIKEPLIQYQNYCIN